MILRRCRVSERLFVNAGSRVFLKRQVPISFHISIDWYSNIHETWNGLRRDRWPVRPTKYCARAYNNIIGPEDDTWIGKISKKFNKIVHNCIKVSFETEGNVHVVSFVETKQNFVKFAQRDKSNLYAKFEIEMKNGVSFFSSLSLYTRCCTRLLCVSSVI